MSNKYLVVKLIENTNKIGYQNIRDRILDLNLVSSVSIVEESDKRGKKNE